MTQKIHIPPTCLKFFLPLHVLLYDIDNVLNLKKGKGYKM